MAEVKDLDKLFITSHSLIYVLNNIHQYPVFLKVFIQQQNV